MVAKKSFVSIAPIDATNGMLTMKRMKYPRGILKVNLFDYYLKHVKFS